MAASQEGTTENLVSLLSELQVPEPPPPISMMPETQGWVVLAAIFLALVAWRGFRYWQRWQANAYRRQALRDLSNPSVDAALVAEVLRRTALVAWPRQQVAGLIGQDWIHFLNRTGPAQFQGELAETLLQASYVSGTRLCSQSLHAAAVSWIRGHRASEEPGR